MISEAIEGYSSVVEDFDQLLLKDILHSSEPFKDTEVKIFTAVLNALVGLQRVLPQGLSAAQREMCDRLDAALNSLP